MKEYHHLSLAERVEAAALRKAGWGIRRIAREFGRSPSTISREFKRNESLGFKYNPEKAHAKAKSRVRGRPRKKIRPGTKELEFVIDGIMSSWSAQRISGRYGLLFPGRILSRQAVSRFIYSEEFGRMSVSEYVTWQRTQHTKRGRRKAVRVVIPDRIGIENRTEAADARLEFGHWECDLMCFTHRKGVILQFVERKTRYGIAVLLPSKCADVVIAALSCIIARLLRKNQGAVKSVTFDNGKEFTRHAELRKEFGVATFFCNPYSSWEKGTVENANGILRRYLPRISDLGALPQSELNDIRTEMNNLPLALHKYLTSAEVFRHEMLQSPPAHPVALHL